MHWKVMWWIFNQQISLKRPVTWFFRGSATNKKITFFEPDVFKTNWRSRLYSNELRHIQKLYYGKLLFVKNISLKKNAIYPASHLNCLRLQHCSVVHMWNMRPTGLKGHTSNRNSSQKDSYLQVIHICISTQDRHRINKN